MRTLLIVTALALTALAAAVASLYMSWSIAKSSLSCRYFTYINTSCVSHVCTFDIPARSGKWYRIVEVKCSGTGMLNIYFTTGHGVYAKIEGNGIAVVLGPNETTSLPVRDSAIYNIYVMTNITLGRAVGRLVIVEVS